MRKPSHSYFSIIYVFLSSLLLLHCAENQPSFTENLATQYSSDQTIDDIPIRPDGIDNNSDCIESEGCLDDIGEETGGDDLEDPGSDDEMGDDGEVTGGGDMGSDSGSDSGGEDGGMANGGDDGSSGSGVIPPAPPTIAELMEVCGDVSNPDNFDIVTQTVTFESTQGQGCDWENNGNLSKLNQYFRAKRTQTESVTVSSDKLICNIVFDFLKYANQQQNMHYDDLMFLTVRSMNTNSEFDSGDLLIASTEDYNEHFDKVEDSELYKYSWDDLRDEVFDGSPNRSRYCYGAASEQDCVVPGHDQTGNLEVKIDDFPALVLSRELATGNKFEFGFTVTGDNDNTDCQHDTDFTFDVKLYYAR